MEWIRRTIWPMRAGWRQSMGRRAQRAAEQADAADEGRLEASGSIVVGHSAAGCHREPGQGRAPLAADPRCSTDMWRRPDGYGMTATDHRATDRWVTDCRRSDGRAFPGTESWPRITGDGLLAPEAGFGSRQRISGYGAWLPDRRHRKPGDAPDGRAVEQGDAADEVRVGREPRPSQLIPSVRRTCGDVLMATE